MSSPCVFRLFRAKPRRICALQENRNRARLFVVWRIWPTNNGNRGVRQMQEATGNGQAESNSSIICGREFNVSQFSETARECGSKFSEAASRAGDYVSDKVNAVGNKLKDLQGKDI